MEWTVHIETETNDPLFDDTLWALADLGGAATAEPGDHRLGVTLTQTATEPDQALAQALARLRAIIPPAVVAAEVITTAEADRRLAEPAFPELVGVSEIARLFGITRQRASALPDTAPAFPAPVATLASGPVWRRQDLTRFETTWPRRSGRPRQAKTA